MIILYYIYIYNYIYIYICGYKPAKNRDFNRFNHKNGDVISTQASIIGIKRIYCDKLAIWEICT